jgi:hypothetical protein
MPSRVVIWTSFIYNRAVLGWMEIVFLAIIAVRITTMMARNTISLQAERQGLIGIRSGK